MQDVAFVVSPARLRCAVNSVFFNSDAYLRGTENNFLQLLCILWLQNRIQTAVCWSKLRGPRLKRHVKGGHHSTAVREAGRSELIYSDIPIASQRLKNFHGLCGINLCHLQMHDNAKKCAVPPLRMSLPFSSHMFRLNCRHQAGNTYITKSYHNKIILQCLRIPNVRGESENKVPYFIATK
jgi:hypothetical protein